MCRLELWFLICNNKCCSKMTSDQKIETIFLVFCSLAKNKMTVYIVTLYQFSLSYIWVYQFHLIILWLKSVDGRLQNGWANRRAEEKTPGEGQKKTAASKWKNGEWQSKILTILNPCLIFLYIVNQKFIRTLILRIHYKNKYV